MNKTKSKLYFFFSLIGTLLLSACGVRNHHGFVGEDARFANYTFLGTDGDGSAGLAYYADETNPNQIAVSIGTCTATDIVVTTYDNKPVTSVFPSGFQNCDTIQTITLPDTVTVFGTDAFAGSSLQSITIPKNLEVIASGSFRNCKSLDTVRFKKDNQLNTINDYAFANCYTLATFPFHEIENLRTIGKEAFLYCIELTSIVFPDHFTTLESYAFQDCKSLTTIYFPASTAYVAANAFRGVGHSARIYFSQSEPGSESSSSTASASSSITPMSLAEDFNFSYGNYYIPVAYGVGQMKFDDDYPYFQFITPDTGDYPLYICTTGSSESSWKSTANIEYTEHIAKNEVLIMNYTGVGIANINIPSTILNGAFKVVGIMSEVFKARADIKKVTFHENLRFIDFGAFRDCTKLTDIELSDAVDLKYIQSRAFFNTIPSSGGDNASLYSIHIPSNVENIAADAFRSCDGLFRLYFDGATNEYEEAFLCPATGSFSFDLAYEPLSISSITFDGPDVDPGDYTLSGKRITLTGRKGGVARVKYTTNSTTTQTFTGHKDEENVLVSEFVLASKTDSSSIGSVTVNGSAAAYTVSDYDSTSKITLTTAPAEGATIVVKYRGQAKLQKIGDYAFYGCSSGFGSKNFYGLGELRKGDNPFSNIYFPATLEEIGVSAFANGQFIGGVEFKSMSLIIRTEAFSEQKSLSSIKFPTSVTSLNLGQKCFSSGLGLVNTNAETAAGNLYKKLISVVLPANTTVSGNFIFNRHIFVAIYCIGKKPNGIDSFTQWNDTHDGSPDILEVFGSFSSAADKAELDYAPVYVVESADDIVTLPDEEHPIFDFVKQVDDNDHEYAVLANYHYYGGRIKDQDGDAAIIMGTNSTITDLTTNNTDYINSDYDSEYAVMLPNGHFRFEIPYQVLFGETWLDVEEIGKAAMAVQINNSNMHPRGDNPGTSAPNLSLNSTKYWKEGENFWTMREINLPNCVKTISDVAMAFVPFTTLKSYGPGSEDNILLTVSDDGLAKLWNHSDEASTTVGKFPKNLTTLGKKACVYSGITSAMLPSRLQVFGDVTSSGPRMAEAYYQFPFMGCFELSVLEIYDAQQPGDPAQIFAGAAGSGVISMASDGKMIEGAGAKLSINIPWGTKEMVSGALRGGRKIQNVVFPYTLKKISNNFLDTIGNGRDPLGRSGQSDLQTVKFGGLTSEYAGSTPGANPPDVPQCTEIQKSAFYGATNLQTFEFPINLTTLGQWAFIDCNSLSKISVDRGDTLGSTPDPGTSHLNFSLLPSLKSIGSECFLRCRGITEITTNSALTSIGDANIFSGCTGLTALNLNSATASLGRNCFGGCTNLPSVSFNTAAGNKLGDSCFSGCTNLTSITFNGTKNTLGASCFSGCSKLETITFSVTQSGTTFSNNAFANCTSLKTVVIPTGVTVNKNVFKGCTGLDDNVNSGGGVIVGAGVTFTAGGADSAFIDCGADTRIFLGDTQAQYESGSARYAGGWNYYYHKNGSGNYLRFYLFAETDPGASNPSWGYWHWQNGVVGGTPVVWREKGAA